LQHALDGHRLVGFAGLFETLQQAFEILRWLIRVHEYAW